ncbi:YhcH/YjgK/YiaL family protein [Geminisphaera colitermitum]|uniref:YhcH/YjgK/YiaL family protein n=1 Tax=Geminisphaera colitermitum TaxID=1148786 RepID=UPI000158DC0E|nr:YhcH/YjgK/YiaL family protein [Geminisphaera colitermitum]
MAVFGSLDTVCTQLAASRGFSLALDYVARCLTPGSAEHRRILAIQPGQKTPNIELGEGVFAMEQVYQTKPHNEGRWEAHRAYIDVQVIIQGAELMEIAETSRLQVEEDHTPGRDVLFFRPIPAGATGGGASVLLADTGFVGVFFPVDAHRPSLAVTEGRGIVHKTVVKVPVGV